MFKTLRLGAFAAIFLAFTLLAHAAPPPAIPPVPDSNRTQTYSITSPTPSIQVPFNVYGDCTDIVVTYNGVLLVLNTDYTCASASGTPIANLPLPITDMVVTFATTPTTNLPVVPPTSGQIIINGAWHPRQTVQPTAPGINRREFNQTVSTIISGMRELYQFSQQTVGAPAYSLIYVAPNGALVPIAPASGPNQCFISINSIPPYGWGSCGGSGGGGNVSGPSTGGSTDDDISAWDGTTGTLLKDTHIPFNAYPAADVVFTQQGTGAVATNLGARAKQEWIYSEDYATDCSGTNDSTTALTNAVAASIAAEVELRTCQGTIKINESAGIPVSGQFVWGGSGRSETTIENTNNAGKSFSLNSTAPVYIHDVGFSDAGTPTAGAAIFDNSNGGSNNQYIRVGCKNVWVCLDLEQSAQWIVDGGSFVNYFSSAISVQNTNAQDAGDSTVSNSEFLEFQGGVCATAGVGIFQQGSGGLKITSNKFNCGQRDYWLDVSNTGSSSDTLITGNSMENCAGGCIVAQNQSTGTWQNISIVGNEIRPLISTQIGIFVTGNAASWLTNLTISGNTGLADNAQWANINMATNVAIVGNAVSGESGGSPTFLNVGTVTHCVSANNAVAGLSSTGTCTP